MKKKILLITTVSMMFLMTSCGPKKETMEGAQDKFRELVNAHNAVSNAYEQIDDGSYDDELKTLDDRIAAIEETDISSVKASELNEMILEMDGMIERYSEILIDIDRKRTEEEANKRFKIAFTLVNATDLSFTDICLEEDGNSDSRIDILNDDPVFSPNDEIIGPSVYMDPAGTSWKMTLNTEENSYELTIDPTVYDKEKMNIITISVEEDGEEKSLKLN